MYVCMFIDCNFHYKSILIQRIVQKYNYDINIYYTFVLCEIDGFRIVYITEKRARHHAQNATYVLFAAASLFRLTGWFHIHLFSFI